MAGQNITDLFNEIYDFTNQKVILYVTAKCGRTSDIGDIFQEIYLEVYAALKRHGPDYVLNREAFVMKIAKQKVFRYYSFLARARSVIPMFSENEKDEEVNLADLGEPTFTFENEVSEKALISQVNRFLCQKPEEIRKIFILYYSLDKTIPEISKLLFLSESNVKNKLYRTLKELRKLYDKDGACNE